MRLLRINKIRGFRAFREFNWPAQLHPFAQANVIFGWNGAGKTTLSAILAHLERKESLPEGDVDFTFDRGPTVSGDTLEAAALPPVRVFNRDFVAATVQSFDEGLSPIYYIGAGTAEKQGKLESLKKKRATAQLAIERSSRNLADAESALDRYCRQGAKLIKELLTSPVVPSYNTYDKRRFRLGMQAAAAVEAASVLSDAEKERLRRQKDSRPKNALAIIDRDLAKLQILVDRVAEAAQRGLIVATLAELVSNPRLSSWIEQGLALHPVDPVDATSSQCGFCLGEISVTRRKQLEAHFNDELSKLQSHLDMLEREVEDETSRLRSLSHALPDPSRFHDHLVDEASSVISAIRERVDADIQGLAQLQECVASKRNMPFGSTTVPVVVVDDWAHLIDSFNRIAVAHNEMTADFTRAVAEAQERLEQAQLAESIAEFTEMQVSVSSAEDRLKLDRSAMQLLQADIDTLEVEVLEHRRPADELNAELREYLGRDELRFELRGSGYSLTRSGSPVSHLSEGERTAIAFLYFLKSLQDKSFAIEKGIVVIDDPVSSLDANALFSAFGYMKERTKSCGQLIILTHSFSLLRLVKNWFHHLKGQRKSDPTERPARFYMLRPVTQSDGRRSLSLEQLDRLLETYESEYVYLFKRVHDEARRTDVISLEHHYGMPNVARRLLEAFLAFRFPEMSGDLGPRLDRVPFDSARKVRILRLLNTYSHGATIAEPEHDLSLLLETQPVLNDVLELMKSVDPEHYAGLEQVAVSST
jgi:wobble nucleotide-excising tRNase